MAASSNLITDFWSMAVPPPGMEQSLAAWRAMIIANQNQCATTCSLKRSVHLAGAMQNRRRLAMALLQAVLSNCTMVDGWPSLRMSHLNTGLTLRHWCAKQNRTSEQCYFLPVSNCHWRPGVSVDRQLISLYDMSAALERVGQLTGLRSELLVMGTVLSWVMRPQPELREALEHYGNVLGLSRGGARHRRIPHGKRTPR